MEKYLFNDGTNVIRELQSKEELDKLIEATPDRDKIRIWLFSTSEWITYSAYSRSSPAVNNPPIRIIAKDESASPIIQPVRKKNSFSWIKRPLIVVAILAVALVIYNFTRITWTKLPVLQLTAGRPENNPPVDADSLIQSIEYLRGVKLDKITKTNLRIRNTWPDRIGLQMEAAIDSSSVGKKFYNVNLTLDNATGYMIDEVIAEVSDWKGGDRFSTDTVHFKNINYTAPAKRDLLKEYRGDSLSISIQSIKAKSFNFCYSADKKSNYGNFNDRWFCK